MKAFWEKQAVQLKEDVRAVNFDPILDDLENFYLEKLIGDNEVVCDLGCGNGRATINLAQKKQNCLFYGLDFAANMIMVANEQKNKLNVANVHFMQYDATTDDLLSLIDVKFDKIISKRLLINLKGEDKVKAIRNIHSTLKDNGKFIMIECFTEPLSKINDIRNKLNLNEITIKFFNEYLSLNFFDKIKDLFSIDQKIDFGSLYYFISRIFNAVLSEGTPDYFAPMNTLAAELIKMGVNPIEQYSPEIIFVLKKR
jgi:ubiquinone/menaquinone biosynthesis C-methylase UbiE